MRKKKGKRFLYILLFIVLLPLLLVELIFKGIYRLCCRKKKNGKYGDREFYESLSIERVDVMDGIEFEKFLKRLFIYKGYSVSETARTGDFGADLLLCKDGKTIVVQAKRYNNNVGAKAIQEIFSARHHYGADEMMVVSNAHFTKQAEQMAREQRVDLIDRDELAAMIDEVKLELGEKMIEDAGSTPGVGGDIYDNFKYRI